MIYLTAIEVRGDSDVGSFRGSISLTPGLQVISAHNSYGKSLASRAVAWCLGLEPMFGVPDNSTSCFPLAVREEIELDGKSVRVQSSECSISLAHSDGRRLTIARDIKGDPSVVRVDEVIEGKIRRSKLQARLKTMQDEHC